MLFNFQMAPQVRAIFFTSFIFIQVYLGNAQTFIHSKAAYYPNSEEKGTESEMLNMHS